MEESEIVEEIEALEPVEEAARIEEQPETEVEVAAPRLSIIPLGGYLEIGKNMTAIRYGKKILCIDCGLMFPEDEMLGVDLVIPDVSFLVENAGDVLGICLTHGHEDHIGALPYVLRQIETPVWGTRLTLGLVQNKLSEHHLDDVELHPVTPGDTVEIGPFRVEFIRVTHSIPESVSLAIHTPEGILVHSSDFKFDQTPVDGKTSDISRFARLGDEGVLVLLTDSTNVEKPGFTPSERMVGATFGEVFKSAGGRIIVSTFASNIHRVQQVLDVACRYGRKVAFAGRSMAQNVEIASQLGNLRIPEDTRISLDHIKRYDPSEIVIMSTGSQGEPLSSLTRMATDEHKQVKIIPGDTVIISATPIPGNEDLVMRTINHLFRRGANVIYDKIAPVHVSGHGNQEDLKLLVNLVRPQYIIPTHGEHRHVAQYIRMVEEMGIAPERIFKLDIGDVLEMDPEYGPMIVDKVTAGNILVDGIGVGDVSDVVLRDRLHLAQDGVFIVTVSIDKETGELLAGPEIISRGFIYMDASEELIEEARLKIQEELETLSTEEAIEWTAVKQDVRRVVGKFLYERTHRRPMVMPVIMEV
ncbi:MAG: ribonuclease J [Armatimonadetes bacterium]|nr:ribonuclease J [Armatimonadota bacterium]